MKKVCIIFLLSIIISLTALGLGDFSIQSKANGGTMSAMNGDFDAGNAFLRIHIRADSNDEEAQAVKYLVRDRVVEYLTPLVATYQTKRQAMQGVESHLDELSKVATLTLRERGFGYVAKATIKREYFPTRVYGETTLPSGEYTALILTLGRGDGDNWWCVVYPPLCFAGTDTNVFYRSRILEIIEDWQEKNK